MRSHQALWCWLVAEFAVSIWFRLNSGMLWNYLSESDATGLK